MLENIQLGAKLNNAEGHELGEVKYLVADPQNNKVTHLVVEKGLGMNQKVLAASTVREVSANGSVVLVELDDLQLEALPDFIEREYRRPGEHPAQPPRALAYEDSGYLYPIAGLPGLFEPGMLGSAPLYEQDTDYVEKVNVPGQSLIINEGAEVEALDGRVGRVKEVYLNEDDTLQRLVVEKGFFFPEEYSVPASLVEQADEYRVKLNTTKAELQNGLAASNELPS